MVNEKFLQQHRFFLHWDDYCDYFRSCCDCGSCCLKSAYYEILNGFSSGICCPSEISC